MTYPDFLDSEVHRAERQVLAKRIVVWLVAVVVLLVLCMALAHAEAIAVSGDERLRVTLTDEPCTLDAVENLKQRATWEEDGKVTEGCYGAHPLYPVIVFYFADKAVVIVHRDFFQKAQGV